MKERKISKAGKRGVVILVVLVAISLIASAGLLPYFGRIRTTVNVENQVVEIGNGNPIVWHPYNNPIEHTISHTSPGGETFCFKQWIRNSASIDVAVSFTTSTIAGVETKIHVLPLTTTLLLENKDTNWNVIDDNTQATITFDTVADTFNYDLTATGLTPETDYSLIYYADFEDKFNNWGGNNGGIVIDTFLTDTNGDNTQSNSVDLGMNMPRRPDANIDIHDYSGDPDFYSNSNGAKLWVVPMSDLTSGDLPVQNWSPSDFLFETNLIIYLDCNEVVDDFFCGLLGEAITEQIILQSGQIIPTLICYKFDLHIGKGTYLLDTIVDATEA